MRSTNDVSARSWIIDKKMVHSDGGKRAARPWNRGLFKHGLQCSNILIEKSSFGEPKIAENPPEVPDGTMGRTAFCRRRWATEISLVRVGTLGRARLRFFGLHRPPAFPTQHNLVGHGQSSREKHPAPRFRE